MGALDWAVDTADELLTEFGKPVTFYREKKDVPVDDNKPWRPDGVLPDPSDRHSVIAMTVPYAERQIDGTMIQRGDVKCLLAAKGLTYEPRPGDYADFSGKKFIVVNVSTLEPGVDRVLYEMQLRG